MTSSLVGSEMCIRDRLEMNHEAEKNEFQASDAMQQKVEKAVQGGFDPVSYTHLTLPTICSV
eukprot:170062-Prorocentrum_lima.AAC.1